MRRIAVACMSGWGDTGQRPLMAMLPMTSLISRQDIPNRGSEGGETDFLRQRGREGLSERFLQADQVF